jgi:hypothetical protein
VRTLSRLVLVIASVFATACIADKMLGVDDKCPLDPPAERVCEGTHDCGYGTYNLCKGAPQEMVCTCTNGVMSCDPQAAQNYCYGADVPQDTTTTDAPETDADAEVVDVPGE